MPHATQKSLNTPKGKTAQTILCGHCGNTFEFLDDDLKLLKKLAPEIGGKRYELPPPTLCFDCRIQRRLAFYNCRTLYKRKCDATGKDIISVYSPDKPFTVYDTSYWYGDKWNALDYGREVDFSRPFMKQVCELRADVPQIALAVFGDNVNSDFTNDNYKTKNCYLVFDGEQAESCYHLNTFAVVKSCMDCLTLMQDELCYAVTAAAYCYNLKYSRFCGNCSESWFLRNCSGCKNCFGCANLIQKQYYIFNEPKTKEEYEDFMAGFHSSKHSEVEKWKAKVEEFFDTQPVKSMRGLKNEDTVGDALGNCKDAYMCFESSELRDCRYCTNCLMGARDCMDVHIWGDHMELVYETALAGMIRGCVGGYYVGFGSENLFYCLWCTRGCHNLFGCVGLMHKDYCILNKQYTKEEYEELVPRIIEHMRQTGEWGEYFDHSLSAFGYNETKAQEYFPMEKEEVLQKGWKWCDYDSEVTAEKVIDAADLPDDSEDIPDDVLNWAIRCEVTGKPFKLIKPELQFYREHNLPIPRRHPDQRHLDRMVLKGPYKLFDRVCAKCGNTTLTSFQEGHPYPVYCEACYQKEFHS